MRICIYMLYPQGKPKALTLSYDDGVVQDIRFMEVLNRYGIKCTFNLNSERMCEEKYDILPQRGVLSIPDALELYKGSGHEIAVHTLSHPFLERIPTSLACKEIIGDRIKLEEIFGGIVRGMAYPYGTLNDDVAECIRLSNIAYARTTLSTESFRLPDDWIRLKPTSHHNNPKIFELCENFVNGKPYYEPWLFYLWGHSYEFDDNNNWDKLESICKLLSNHDDIWYATNIEVYDYVTAYKRLEYSASTDLVYNPSAIPVWICFNESTVCINPGEYKKLY